MPKEERKRQPGHGQNTSQPMSASKQPKLQDSTEPMQLKPATSEESTDRRPWTKEENTRIKSRRAELINKEHLTDGEISKKLASEFGRTPDSIKKQIGRLIKADELEENPYKRSNGSVEDVKAQIEALLRRYVEQGPAQLG